MGSNWDALEAEIMKKARAAMDETEHNSIVDTSRNMSEFHTVGTPEFYQWTHQIEDTPRSTGVSQSGNTLEATIYLDSQYEYNTGSYTAAKVMSEAEVGGSGILGKKGFWKQSKEDIEKNKNSAFGKRFR